MDNWKILTDDNELHIELYGFESLMPTNHDRRR